MSIRNSSKVLTCLHQMTIRKLLTSLDQRLLKKLRNTQKCLWRESMSFRMLQEYWRTLSKLQRSCSTSKKLQALSELKSLLARIQKRNSRCQMFRNQSTTLQNLISFCLLWLININMVSGEKSRILFEPILDADLIIFFFLETNRSFKRELTWLFEH